MEFVWSGTGLAEGKLQQLSVDGQNLPWPSLSEMIVNLKLQRGEHEAKRAGTLPSDAVEVDSDKSLTMTDKQCVMLPAGKFLYMDVGCWLHGKQYFGLIAGTDAYVCEYAPGLYVGTKFRPKACEHPIEEFLGIPGVGIHDRKKIVPAFCGAPLPPFCSDQNRVYLILPDMHVPAAPPLDMAKPSNLEGFGDLKQGNWRVDPTGWGELAKRDFFGSRQSIPALTEFLSIVATLPAANSTIFVQLGDMYELWADRPCEFKEVSDQEYCQKSRNRENAVELLPGGRHTTTADMIGDWIAETHDMHWKLFSAFDACVQATQDQFFLHGNHDSYLSLPEVVGAANRSILESSIIKTDWGPRQIFPATNVYPRQRDVLLDGMFIEHGQRYDWANRDGHQYGHRGTELALNWPPLGVLDSVRRKSFVAGATAWWTLSRGNFGLYVQGHTHTPDLKYVEVAHVRADRTWVQLPAGDFGAGRLRVQIETKTSL